MRRGLSMIKTEGRSIKKMKGMKNMKGELAKYGDIDHKGKKND